MRQSNEEIKGLVTNFLKKSELIKRDFKLQSDAVDDFKKKLQNKEKKVHLLANKSALDECLFKAERLADELSMDMKRITWQISTIKEVSRTLKNKSKILDCFKSKKNISNLQEKINKALEALKEIELDCEENCKRYDAEVIKLYLRMNEICLPIVSSLENEQTRSRSNLSSIFNRSRGSSNTSTGSSVSASLSPIATYETKNEEQKFAEPKEILSDEASMRFSIIIPDQELNNPILFLPILTDSVSIQEEDKKKNNESTSQLAESMSPRSVEMLVNFYEEIHRKKSLTNVSYSKSVARKTMT